MSATLRGPHSLRARLLAGVVALTALILTAIGWTLYAQQRSFTVDRVDQLARSVLPQVDRALSQAGVPGGGAPLPPATPGGPAPWALADDLPDHGPSGRGALQAAIFGQRRTASGTILGTVRIGLNVGTPSQPQWPRHLPPGHAITVLAAAGGGRYRVVANRSRYGTLTLAAVSLDQVSRDLGRLLRNVVLLSLLGLVVLGVFAWLVIAIALRPLTAIGATAGAIAAGDLSRRVERDDERTEVGRLGRSLNAMLGQIERAFTRRRESEEQLRRFLADASHELRTPLSAIRGYAELYRMGAAQSPVQVSHAMERIESESARMGVLVEDLLTLARLDEPRDPRREPVALAALAADAVIDAIAADASGRAIVLTHADQATVVADPDGLRQVLGNLLRNALVHTPAGTPIEVEVSRDDAAGTASVSVRDHGPGLPDGDPALLFERFWRAAPGRGRGPAGSGLGLAIVAGIVAAHEGTVTAGPAPDGGARFLVVLPLARDHGEPAP